jgi:hypothetical protein
VTALAEALAVELAAAVLDGWLRGLPCPPACVVKLLMAALLPERVREGFGLPWGQREQQHYAALRRVLHATVPCLPPALRFWPHYHVALKRAAAAPSTVGASQSARTAHPRRGPCPPAAPCGVVDPAGVWFNSGREGQRLSRAG